MEIQNLQQQFDYYLKQNINIDMSRGKPSPQQLDISNDILNQNINYFIDYNGKKFDIRNYGILEGLPDLINLFSEILDVEQIIITGNSTLNTIFDCITRLYIWGYNGKKPWANYKKIKIICPCPAYDRHIQILEKFNFEIIPTKFKNNDLDMEHIEKLVENDGDIKGIMCVPLYSNPTGACYSDDTVKRLAKLNTKSDDFRIFWDNAYALHYVYEKITLKNILKEAEKYGKEDRIFYFFSTSKINFPGSGIAILAGSYKTIKETKQHMSIQTIGYDKISQINTLNFLKNKQNVLNIMDLHANILKSKFEIVFKYLEKNFSENDLLTWDKPKGGYFISVYTKPKCATKIVEKCSHLGLTLTPAGTTYPKNMDLDDTNIRLAPSYVDEKQLKIAMEIFCLCVKIVSYEHY